MSQSQQEQDKPCLEGIIERYAELFALLDGVDLRMSPRSCARCLAIASAAELERELKRRGLPRFRVLRNWYYVLRLHQQAQGNASLSIVAAQRGDYPSILYRFVQRTTGRDWREISKPERASVGNLAISAWHANGLSIE